MISLGPPRKAAVAAALGLVLAGGIGAWSSIPPAQARRSAKAILADYDAVRTPSQSRGTSPEALAAFESAVRRGSKRRAELALELYLSAQDHARVPTLMQSRWMLMCNALDLHGAVDVEVGGFLGPERSKPLRVAAHWARAHARLELESHPRADKLAAVEAALALDGDSDFGSIYLHRLAGFHTPDMAEARELCDRILARWDQGEGAAGARRLAKALDRVGQVHDFRLAKALGHSELDSAAYRGAPLLVHVWIGGELRWISESLAELVALRKTHPDLAVVSLCLWTYPGGTQALAEAAEAHGVRWPIGLVADLPEPEAKALEAAWEPPRSPCFYLLDAEGRLEAVALHRRVLTPHLERLSAPEAERGEAAGR